MVDLLGRGKRKGPRFMPILFSEMNEERLPAAWRSDDVTLTWLIWLSGFRKVDKGRNESGQIGLWIVLIMNFDLRDKWE